MIENLKTFKQFINEELNNYPFQKFYDEAQLKYGQPLTKGEYVGTGRPHDCDKNSFKHRDTYRVFKGELVPKIRTCYDGSRINHIFNVDDNGNVVEFTNLTVKDNIWQTEYYYFGKEIPKGTKLKDIWEVK